MTKNTTGEDDTLIDQEEELDTEDETVDTPNEDEDKVDDDQEDSSDDNNSDDDDDDEDQDNKKDWKKIAENYKIRAEKAEKENKGRKQGSSKPNNSNSNQGDRLSDQDMYVLLENKVPSADFKDVVEYARFKRIPVEEALGSTVVKTMLREKAEIRATAKATQTGSQRRQSGRVSDQDLVSNARQGKLPENDADIERLAKARIASKKKRGK